MEKKIFIAFDGDNIGSHIEYLILINDIEKLAEFSATYEKAMQWLVKTLIAQFQATLIFTGGDNSLLFADISQFSLELLKEYQTEFYRRTGRTLSTGLGDSPRQAYFALKLAKTSGKNTIRHYEEMSE